MEMTGFAWFLVGLIISVLALAFCVFTVWKIWRMNKQSFYVLLIYLGILIGLLFLHTFEELNTYEIIHIIAVVTLVLVTAVYAVQTTSMAKEMREQRYDAVRPVIDIEWWPAAGEEGYVRVAGVLAIEKGKPPQSQLPDKLTCILRNIGLGTATDVYSFVQAGTQPDDECHRPRALGTLAKNEATDKWPLFLKQKDDHKFLVAYYRDVYGRCFKSSREVSRDEVRGNLKLGTLDRIEIAKEEFPK